MSRGKRWRNAAHNGGRGCHHIGNEPDRKRGKPMKKMHNFTRVRLPGTVNNRDYFEAIEAVRKWAGMLSHGVV